jgi:hypothetical protein
MSKLDGKVAIVTGAWSRARLREAARRVGSQSRGRRRQPALL